MSDVEDQPMELPPDQTRPQRQVGTEDAGDDSEPDISRSSEASSVSSLTSSKPSSKRSAAHKLKKIQKTMQRVREKKLAMGMTWQEAVAPEEYREMKTKAISEEKPLLDFQKDLLLPFRRLELEQQAEFQSIADYSGKPTDAQVMEESARNLQDGRCTLCGKIATTGHTASAEHRRRCGIAAALTGLAGSPDGDGRRKLYSGVPSPISQELIRRHWGMSLHLMPQKALKILHEKGCMIKFRDKENATHIEGHMIQSTGLAVVPYNPSADSKYEDSALIRWEQLPESLLPVAAPDSGAASSNSFGRGFGVDTAQQRARPDQTWWPVVFIYFNDGAGVHMGLQRADGVWLVCIYQLLDAGAPWAWFCKQAGWVPAPPPPQLPDEGVFAEAEDWEMVGGAASAAPPPPPTWGDTQRPGAMAMQAEEVD